MCAVRHMTNIRYQLLSIEILQYKIKINLTHIEFFLTGCCTLEL